METSKAFKKTTARQQHKQELLDKLVKSAKSWHIPIASDRDLKRMSIETLKQELNRVQVRIELVREKLVKEKGKTLIRPSGLQLVKLIPPKQSGIMFYKKMLSNTKSNEVVKVLVKKSSGAKELMMLCDFISWIEGYNSDDLEEVLEIQLYRLKLHGGCATKEQKGIKLNVNNWEFNVDSIKTEDNDCLFACFNRVNKISRYTKTIRKEMGYQKGQEIDSNDLQKFADKFKLNVIFYYPNEEKVHVLDFKCSEENDTLISILLLNNHYYLVNSVIRPEFLLVKTKLDTLLQKSMTTDACNFKELNEEDFKDFDEIVKYIIDNPTVHFQIIGQGGVGKSVLSRMIKAAYNKNYKPLLMTSTTGISAINIGGTTIHRQLFINQKGFKSDILVDEIGFASGELFDRIVNKLNGKRLIMVGDLMQLPPVEMDTFGLFFEGMNYKPIHNNLVRINLNIIKRQQDIYYGEILKKVRHSIYDEKVIKFLKSKIVKRKPLESEMIFSSRNVDINAYNDIQMKKLIESKAQSFTHTSVQKWDMNLLKQVFKDDESGMKQYMAKNIKDINKEKKTTYYIGQHVILTNNMPDFNLANGSKGIISSFSEDSIYVCFNGVDVKILPIIRHKKQATELYSEKIPLIPAYALTIHKSQGMTINQPIYLNLKGVWCNELIYVALSRTTDHNLISISHIDFDKLSSMHINQTVSEYLNENYFEQFGYRMMIESEQKQMKIRRKPDNKLLNQNSIYMDYETAEYKSHSGLICHKPYYNHITHYKHGVQTKTKTYHDLTEKTKNCDVAKQTYDHIMKEIQEFENLVIATRKTKDKNKLNQVTQNFIRLITYNGAGFDLYFLLDQILQTEGFTTLYQINNIFKGNKLVFFTLYSQNAKCVVLQSFDIFQITSPSSLEKACESYCPEQAKKLVFKNEIIYLAKNRYMNPECIQDQETRINSEEVVTYTHKGWKMDKLKETDNWTIEPESIQQLETIKQTQTEDQLIGRRFKIKIFKNINLYQALQNYANNDTEVLPILLESLDKLSFRVFNCSILHFLTSGSMCWYGFQYYAPENIYADKKYDQNRNAITRKLNASRKTHIYKNEMDEENFLLKAVIGGKTCPRMTKLPNMKIADGHLKQNQITQLAQQYNVSEEAILDQQMPYIYLDISGMYCDLMKEYIYPFGEKQWLNKQQMNALYKDLTKYAQNNKPDAINIQNIKEKVLALQQSKFSKMFVCEAEFEENPLSLEPVIAYKKKIGGTNEKPIYKTMYTNERRTQTISSTDLLTVLIKGGKLYSINKCLQFDMSGNILSRWMQECLKIKQQGKDEKLDALTAFGKLLANGTYGQTLKQDKHEVTKFVKSQWEIDQFSKYKLKNVFIGNSDTDILIGSELVNKAEFVTSRCSYIGVFVLAYSRLIIQDICQSFNPEQDPTKQLLVGDTDSLLVRYDLVVNRLIPSGYVQNKSGLLADELADTCKQQFFYPPNPKNITNQDIKNPDNYKFCLVDNGLFIQPKTLEVDYIDINGVRHDKFRAKGISINSEYGENRECMSAKLFKDLYFKSQSEGHGIQVQLPEGIKLITPSLLQGDLNQYTEKTNSGKVNIKKSDALFKVVRNHISRKVFNTSYKGRSISKFDQNIYLPFGHPDCVVITEQIKDKQEQDIKEQQEFDEQEYQAWLDSQMQDQDCHSDIDTFSDNE